MDKNEQITYEITPPHGLGRTDFREIWQHRELFYILVWRNIKVRYKQTVIGASWAIFQPLFTMIVFTIFFGKLAKIPSDNAPYAIFVYTALLYWNYFSASLMSTSSSLLENQNIIKKVYFPRLIIPIVNSLTPAIDFFLAFLILFAIMFFYHYSPSFLGILLIPVLLLVVFLIATGLGLIAASLNVRYRDVPYLLGFFIQVLFYISPIIYPLSIIPQKFQWLIFLNPMAGVIIVARSSLLHTSAVDWRYLFISFGAGVIFFILGIIYFRKSEHFFADIL